MEHEDKSYRTSLRRIRRDLKYQTCDELIGDEVLIESRKSFAAEVKDAIREKMPYVSELRSGGFFGMYTFLDLTFDLAPQPDCKKAKLRLLQDYGYLPTTREEALAAAEPHWNPMNNGVLFVLEEELDLDRLVLRLFLEPKNPRLRRPETKEPDWEAMIDAVQREKFRIAVYKEIEQLLDASFPIQYLITDACITNAAGIWLFKHFHM